MQVKNSLNARSTRNIQQKTAPEMLVILNNVSAHCDIRKPLTDKAWPDGSRGQYFPD